VKRQMPPWLAKLILALALPARRRTAFTVVLGVLGIISVYLLFILITMRERGIGREQVFENPAVFLEAALVPLLLVAILIISALVLGILTRLSARWYHSALGAALARLGLSGKPFLGEGWQYYGTVAGREIDVIAVLPRRSSKQRLGGGFTGKNRPHVAVSVRAAHYGTLSLMPAQMLDKKSLDREFKCLEVQSRGFEGMIAVTSDMRWGNRLFADPSAKAALKRLCVNGTSQYWDLVTLQPGTVTFLSYFKRASVPEDEISGRFTFEQIRQWIEDLETIASVAEKLPKPSGATQMPAETDFLLRRNPGAASYAFGLGLGLIVVIWMWFRIITEYVALP